MKLGDWLSTAFFGILIAAGFSAVPFWVPDLSFNEAELVAAVVFPLVLAFYAYAVWRE